MNRSYFAFAAGVAAGVLFGARRWRDRDDTDDSDTSRIGPEDIEFQADDDEEVATISYEKKRQLAAEALNQDAAGDER